MYVDRTVKNKVIYLDFSSDFPVSFYSLLYYFLVNLDDYSNYLFNLKYLSLRKYSLFRNSPISFYYNLI